MMKTITLTLVLFSIIALLVAQNVTVNNMITFKKGSIIDGKYFKSPVKFTHYVATSFCNQYNGKLASLWASDKESIVSLLEMLELKNAYVGEPPNYSYNAMKVVLNRITRRVILKGCRGVKKLFAICKVDKLPDDSSDLESDSEDSISKGNLPYNETEDANIQEMEK